MIKQLSLSILCAVVLAGCNFTPKYDQPEFDAADQWPDDFDYVSPQDAIEAGELPWSEFFESEELNKVISAALENNKDLKIAALNIELARAQYRISRADLVPNADARGGLSLSNSPEDINFNNLNNRSEVYAANLGLSSWEIDLFGRIRSLNNTALNQYLSTNEARDALQISVIAETANAYLKLLADRKLVVLTNQTLQAQQDTYDILKQSLEYGVATELDVARASNAVETAQVNLQIFTRNAAQSKNALVQLVGVKHRGTLNPSLTLDDVTLKDKLDIGIPSNVLLTRPDIRQAEFNLLARHANIGAARAAFFPRITLTGAFGYASDELSGLFSNGSEFAWNIAPQISLPIFQGGRNRANLDIAKIRTDIAIIEYEKAIQSAFREIADELASYGTLSEQLGAQKRLVLATQSAYDISNARYKAGVDNFLSVLDSQREFYIAEQNEIIVQREAMSNLINLYRSLGGGL